VADALLGLRLGSLELREVEGRASVADLPAGRVEQIERLIDERTQARKEKNWARADEIRTELDTLNVQVTDTPAGPVWELR
jgi:cysteinyl-tRNA synthetase